jgi:hypothetical protein
MKARGLEQRAQQLLVRDMVKTCVYGTTPNQAFEGHISAGRDTIVYTDLPEPLVSFEHTVDQYPILKNQG